VNHQDTIKEVKLSSFSIGAQNYKWVCLNKVIKALGVDSEKIPMTIKVLIENVARKSNSHEDLAALGNWKSQAKKSSIPYYPSRVLMQDFTGVPAIVDLAAMRDATVDLGHEAKLINPQCDVDLVIDHSVSVDSYGNAQSLADNVKIEMKRNKERYQFLKWGQKAFKNFRVVPPGNGICHQVNLEYLAKVVLTKEEGEHCLLYPDTLVGTDSHTTMINALGVLGWGVGGIEAEAAMLGQPIDMVIPEVTGVYLTGKLKEGITATDLVLTITEKLREHGVVGKFVEFYGPGVTDLTLSERATIANMSPEFGSTCAFFPIDQESLRYLRTTARSSDHVDLVAKYCMEQGLWHNPNFEPSCFSDHLQINLDQIAPCVAGPRRPQDKVMLSALGLATEKVILANVPKSDNTIAASVDGQPYTLSHGDVVIAAITSCTNTSNPAVLITAGLLAKKALELGLTIQPWVKASFAPGSKVVVSYLKHLGLLEPLEKLGFYLVGYGCTTCIGNSGPLKSEISQAISVNNLCVSAVLSGNRNFEGRIHPEVSMNWLASPPLVIAFALVGSTKINLTRDAIGKDQNGNAIRLSDLWPKSALVDELQQSISSSMYGEQYRDIFIGDDHWEQLEVSNEPTYAWQPGSTYIQRPDFFKNCSNSSDRLEDISSARLLALLDDSVTTDHISPAGFIPANSPAGRYLKQKQVDKKDFNSYGARRGNHNVMVRGTFANIKLKNHCVENLLGGYTTHWPTEEILPIYDAATRYRTEKTPLVVIAGKEYGTGSSRDWAAKGTMMLGVKAVIAESFERIHRSNLVGMGVLPCELVEDKKEDLELSGQELIDIVGIKQMTSCQELLTMRIHFTDGQTQEVKIRARLDTQRELKYYLNGGVLPFVLKEIITDE